MKKTLIFAACAVLLCLTAGCAEKTDAQGSSAQIAEVSEAQQQTADAFTVTADEAVDAAYTDCLKTYFTAIQEKNLDAYLSVLYPPYLEAFQAYLEKQDMTIEQNFEKLCKRFDEDGYESWTISELQLAYYPEEKKDIDGFFEAYTSAGILDDATVEKCKSESQEIQDIMFTLYVLYSGDEEAVPAVTENEIMTVKTADGVYLFG